MRGFGLFLLVLCLWGGQLTSACAAATPDPNYPPNNFPKPLDEYHDDDTPNLGQKLIGRVRLDPFNLVGTLIFVCAILHTFLTAKFMHISHGYKLQFEALEDQEKGSDPNGTKIRHI